MARVRSPNYPQISLPDAIKKVGQVFSRENRHPAPKEVVVKHLGYGGVNGASLGALSALLKYGLLSEKDGSYQVTDRALAILHPKDQAEKQEAVVAAARSPALFADLGDQFKGDPPSDDNLRSYLVRRGFSPSSLSNVIRSYRETIEVAGGEGEDIDPRESDSEMEQRIGNDVAKSPRALPMENQRLSDDSFRVVMTGDRLDVSAGLISLRGIDRLIRILEAHKELLADLDHAAKSSD